MSALEKALETVGITDTGRNDAVDRHFTLYHETKAAFTLIFGMRRLDGMVARLNELRMASSVWQDSTWGFAATEYEATLWQVHDLALTCQCGVYKDRGLAPAGSEEDAHYKKVFHDMCVLLYRFDKTRRKRERRVPVSLLTHGTVVEIQVDGVDKEPRVSTVDFVSSPGGGTGIINTVEKTELQHGNPYNGFFPRHVPRMVNSVHVTRVIKHVPGVPKLVDYTGSMREHYSVLEQGYVGKSRRAYAIEHELGTLIAAIVQEMRVPYDIDQCLDINSMVGAFLTSGQRRVHEGQWASRMLVVRKAKLKRWVRQNMNRFYVSRSDQEARERQAEVERAREYADEWDDEDTGGPDEDD